ncbi:MAG: CoA transferase, partial [Chloroflexota bacterium]
MAREILEGYRVIDWTMYQLGPVNTLMLAMLGAEVIKLERPEGDMGRDAARTGNVMKGGEGKEMGGLPMNAYYEANNQLKKGLVLDLEKPKAKEVLYQLVAKSDVFAQNMRMGVAENLGADYQTLKKYNPKLIYYSGNGFGRKGPDAQKGSMDGAGRARTGMMYLHEAGDFPIGFMTGSSDQMGAIMGAFGIVTALLARERFGIGQEVDASHLSSTLWFMGCSFQTAAFKGELKPAYVARAKSPSMLSSHYKCKDGKWIMLIAPRVTVWEPLCQALGIPESAYKSDPRFNTHGARRANAEATVALLDEYFAKKMRDEWIEIFNKNPKDIIWEKVQKWEDLPGDPMVTANEYITPYTHPATGLTYHHLNFPVKFGETPAMKFGPAPKLGEHTGEILVNVLGYKKEDVPKLIREIGEPVG